MATKTVELLERAHALEIKLVRAEADAALLTEKNIRLTEDNVKLTAALQQAQTAIASNPSYINNIMDLMNKYQETVLQELPLPADVQPEWLTPGDDIPIEASA